MLSKKPFKRSRTYLSLISIKLNIFSFIVNLEEKEKKMRKLCNIEIKIKSDPITINPQIGRNL